LDQRSDCGISANNQALRRENRAVLDDMRGDDWGQLTAKIEFSFGDEDRQVWDAMAEYGQ